MQSIQINLTVFGATGKNFAEINNALNAAIKTIQENGASFKLSISNGLENSEAPTAETSISNPTSAQAGNWTSEKSISAYNALRAYVLPGRPIKDVAKALYVPHTTIMRLKQGNRIGSKNIRRLIEGLNKLKSPKEIIEKFECML